jgi:uncharacterized RDD family membrane protein YckC
MDLLLISLPCAAIARAVGVEYTERGDGYVREGPWWPLLLFPVAFVVYETVFIAWRGNTLGKYAFRVKAVSWEHGVLPTPQEAAIRALVPGVFLLATAAGGLYAFLIVVPVIIYLSSLTDPVYRGWHDKAADTIVLSAPRRGLL